MSGWKFSYQPDGFGAISEGYAWNCYFYRTIDDETQYALCMSFEPGLTWEALRRVEEIGRIILEA